MPSEIRADHPVPEGKAARHGTQGADRILSGPHGGQAPHLFTTSSGPLQ